MCAAVVCSREAAAQPDPGGFQAGVQLAATRSGEFDAADAGVGGRLSWSPTSLLGVEAEINLYPGDFSDAPAFSRRRVEGLFGTTVGPRLRRVRPFAKARPGFLTFGDSPAPLACILIFPPPLRCTLASGHTLLAFDVGGGVEWLASDRAFVRLDGGDRMVRYPAPAIDSRGAVRRDAFFGHDVRITLGSGLRF